MIKSITLSLFVFLALLLSANNAKASTVWSKSGKITFSNSTDWNLSFNRTPSVIFHENTYKLWHDGFGGSYYRIGFATSIDGKFWNNYIDPVLDGSSMNEHYLEPHVIFDDGRYKMWFLSIHSITGDTKILYSDSADGVLWSSPKTALTITEDWESQHLAHPHVIKINNIYHLYYNGQQNGIWRIGLATSIDGKSWNKNINNPIVSPSLDENPTVAGAFISYENSKYFMYYHAKNPAREIKMSSSTDGINWTAGDTILKIDDVDRHAMISPSYVKTNNQKRIYYAGSDGNKWYIAFADLQDDSLFVPLLKQTSNPWQDDVYDKANLWSPSNPTINRWGCAITSAAMILQYHGYDKLPDGTDLDPGTLNTWLNKQRDGYVGSGLLNWIALSRLTKQAKEVNNISTQDALEFVRTGKNNTLLENDLNDGNPAILSQPGHFIVATEKLQDTYAINDPYYDRSTLKEGYANTYQGLYRFVPSNTDLSYIMIEIPNGLSINIFDNNDNLIGERFTEPAIIAPDDESKTSGTDNTVLYVPKPTNGKYKIKISSKNSQPQSINMYVYDIDGNPTLSTLTGIFTNSETLFMLNYNKNNSREISLVKDVTFTSILKDLQNGYKKKLVNKSAYNAVSALIKSSQKDYSKKKIKVSKIKIDTVRWLVSSVFSHNINNEFERMLLSDLKTLKSSL